MRFFWQIAGQIAYNTIREKEAPERGYEAVRGSIWGSIWAYFGKLMNIQS